MAMRADGWDPDLPLSSANHPPCDHCDLGIENCDCTCGNWDDADVIVGYPNPRIGTWWRPKA